MKKNSILLSIFIFLFSYGIEAQVDYAFSYPGILPASDLASSNPTSPQLDPNKIHLVILGDGYHVYDEIIAGQYELTEFPVSNPLGSGNGVPIINRFFNKDIGNNYLGRIGNYEYTTNGSMGSVCGDAEDVLDYIFGYNGPLPRPGSVNGNYSGYTPFKEYKHFFNTYRVLFNSESALPNLNNGIGHPKYINNNLIVTCEPGTTATSVVAPLSSYQSYWESKFDFCDSHAALSCNYDKISDFINEYFPNVPVFVIVIANTGSADPSGRNYGGAANIINQTAVTFSANWSLEDPSNYSNITNYNDEVEHFCLLVALNTSSDPYTMVDNVSWPLFHNVKESNNVAWKNLSIIDPAGGGAMGETTNTDVIKGAEVIVGNNSNSTIPVKLKFDISTSESGNPITTEAELRVTLHSQLWSKWLAGGQTGTQIQIYDSTKHQIKILGTGATLSGLSLDTNEHYGIYLSVNYLTEQRSSKEFFAMHLSHILDDSTQRIIGGETYLFKADPARPLFSADGGGDMEVLVGQAYQNKGGSINESAIFNWYNQQGARIYTGSTRSDSASNIGTEQLTLEVIATSDGYKDYDQVTVTKILGKITSMVPNPISSGTLAIGYKVSTTVSNPKIRLVNINTQAFTDHSISSGTGTLNVNVAGYAAGAYSVVLLDGSSQTIDDELLVIQ